jgi:hypothetical protein
VGGLVDNTLPQNKSHAYTTVQFDMINSTMHWSLLLPFGMEPDSAVNKDRSLPMKIKRGKKHLLMIKILQQQKRADCIAVSENRHYKPSDLYLYCIAQKEGHELGENCKHLQLRSCNYTTSAWVRNSGPSFSAV